MDSPLMKKLQPHLIAVLVFVTLTFAYLSPLLSGKELSQHDIMQWEGMSKEISDYRTQTGQEALWTNAMFSGMPAYQISVVYANNLLQYLNNALWLGLPSPANLLFLCMLGFYLLLITLKTDYRLAIAGALAYAFCSYNLVVIMAGHNSKAHALALFPLVIAGVLMAYRNKYLLGAAVTALGLGLQIYANHLQITYYLAITILILVICEAIDAIRNKTLPSFIKASLVLGIAAILSIFPNITNLWATYEYGEYSTRGPSELTAKAASTGLDLDYALQYSNGKLETFTLLIPGFAGNSSSAELSTTSATYKAIEQNAGDQQARQFVRSAPLYWGQLYSTQGTVYNGAIVVFLFVLSIFLLRGGVRWWLLMASVLFIMLSWGKNFMPLTQFFFDNFPGYNKFRAVSMMLVVASFCIPLGAFLGLNEFFSGRLKKDQLMDYLKKSFYITAGICLFFVLLPGMVCDFVGQADQQLAQYDWLLTALRADRESLVRMDAMRSILFIFLAAAILWAWLKDKMKSGMVFAMLGLVILLDLWTVDKRFLNNDNFQTTSEVKKTFEPTAADLQIMQDKSYYRVMNTSTSTFNDAVTSYFHKSIGGYHGAKLKRYQELVENQISKGNMGVLNMLNAKYFIVQDRQTGQPMVQLNPDANGNAWFVNSWRIVPNADAEMSALDSLDTKNEAVIDQRFADVVAGLNQGRDSAAMVKLTSYAPNKLTYVSQSSAPGLVVFSEVHYPKGWDAYIDGKPATYARVNYVLRGMKIPAGNHEIEFRFEPEVFVKGEKIALAGSVLLFLLFGAAIAMEVKGAKKEGK